jgi:hypothetical protein
MNYIIAMLGGLVMGVYWDAVKNKIGRISGEAEFGYNFSAARWALLSALGVPGAVYLMRRRALLARAAEHPVEATHVRRNMALICCATGLLASVFSLGGAGGNVALVKSGVLTFNQATTVGEALDNYSFFDSCRWENGVASNGIEFVNAIGSLNLDRLAAVDGISKNRIDGLRKGETGISGVDASFQFIINRDGETFEFGFFDLKVTSNDGSVKTINADEVHGFGEEVFLLRVPSPQFALEAIYGDRPLF